MNAELKKIGMGAAVSAAGVIIALLVLEYGKDLPIIKQARDAL